MKLTLEIPDSATYLSVEILEKTGKISTMRRYTLGADEVRDGSAVKLPR